MFGSGSLSPTLFTTPPPSPSFPSAHSADGRLSALTDRNLDLVVALVERVIFPRLRLDDPDSPFAFGGTVGVDDDDDDDQASTPGAADFLRTFVDHNEGVVNTFADSILSSKPRTPLPRPIQVGDF